MNPDRKEKATDAAVAVTFDHVTIAFGMNVVIRDVSLRIEPGEFFAFLGPSGSGKSTLLRAVAGFGPKPSGRILIGDEDVTDQAPWTRDVGMVFQSYALWPHMTVRRNVAFGLEERRLPAANIKERVDWALKVVGLSDYAERRPSQLSGGQQQRVALARTIVIRPRVLLLDEPLSNLDANLRIQMRREIRELQRKLRITTVFVTHDQEEANTMSDRMAVLDNGVIQQVGTPLELYDRPANRFVARFLGTANLIDGRIAGGAASTFHSTGGGLTVPLTRNAAAAEHATILIRPQSIGLTRPGAEFPAERSIFRAAGTVAHREFLGGLIRYGIRLDGDLVIVDVDHQPGRPGPEPGDAVEIAVPLDLIRPLVG